jgi:hypothetical protein
MAFVDATRELYIADAAEHVQDVKVLDCREPVRERRALGRRPTSKLRCSASSMAPPSVLREQLVSVVWQHELPRTPLALVSASQSSCLCAGAVHRLLHLYRETRQRAVESSLGEAGRCAQKCQSRRTTNRRVVPAPNRLNT